MQIRVSNSKSRIYGLPINIIDKLINIGCYVNKSTMYQYSQWLKTKSQKIYWLSKIHHISGQEATIQYYEELEKLKNKRKINLIYQDIDESIVFPTGLYDKIITFLKEKIHNFNEKESVIDLRIKPSPNTKYVTKVALANLYPFQKQALNLCLEKERGTVESATGSGKTLVIQEVIRNLGLPTLLVVPNISIMTQTYKRFVNYFGKDKIGIYGGGKKKIKKITIGCSASIIKSSPEEWTKVQVLITDEGHHLPCNTMEKICYEILPDAYYRFSFTATSYRSDGADIAIEAAGFPIIFRYNIQDAINDGFLAKPSFVMFNVSHTDSNYSGDKSLLAYQRHVIDNTSLNEAIANQVNVFVKEGKRVLILVKEKKHGNILQRKINNSVFVRNAESSSEKAESPYIAPQVKASEAVQKFNEKKIACMIGTSIIGEGTDILPVDILILLTAVASKVNVMQSIGRGLRKCEGKDTVLIIDYIFNMHSILKRHSLMRYKYYKLMVDKVSVFNMDRDGNVNFSEQA